MPTQLKPLGAGAPERPYTIQPSGGAVPFKNILGNLIKDVDDLRKTAHKTTEKLITGELEDVHQVMVAVEEANISFRLMMEVRNKMVEAYKEMMKMQV
ncbi:flagellar hook-basal body complex protein FliE [bacterium]|nr:flagellar hook-basal body complex protein FliE [bacterium]